MQDVLISANQWLSVLLQGLFLVIPIVLSWLLRNYVRGTSSERNIAAIARLANAAIDYAENLDRRGDLQLPESVRKGTYKLKLASDWMLGELERNGIRMGAADARNWVASEFQKRAGGIKPVNALGDLARQSVTMIQKLARNHQVETPEGVDPVSYLAGLAADWVITQLAAKGTAVTREEALTWVRAEFLHQLQAPPPLLADNEMLGKLAKSAVAFVAQMRASGNLSVRPGADGEDIDTDIVAAWVLTEAVKMGLPVTSAQVAQAVELALKRGG
jgi:hypothetical protein